MSCVIITGATGFVGTALVRASIAAGHEVLAVSGDPGRAAAWHAALDRDLRGAVRTRIRTEAWYNDPFARGADALIHLAARVHVMNETSADPEGDFRTANVEGTREAVLGAKLANVRRFVYVSSVKVQGERSPVGGFTESQTLQPSDPYARSKVQAEDAVRALSAEHGVPFVIVRPPLVYGAGVRGNVATLVSWIRRGLPVPVGAGDVRRSMIGVRNLADVLLHCARDARAESRAFLVSDGAPVTLPELVHAIGAAMERRAIAVELPALLLAGLCRVPALRVRMDRMSTPLVVDDALVRRTLGWSPPHRWTDELRHMVGATVPAPTKAA